MFKRERKLGKPEQENSAARPTTHNQTLSPTSYKGETH